MGPLVSSALGPTSLTERSRTRYNQHEVREMPQPKQMLDKLSIYIPQSKQGQNPVERLIKLGKKRDRSVNYLVVEAILQYLEREQ